MGLHWGGDVDTSHDICPVFFGSPHYLTGIIMLIIYNDFVWIRTQSLFVRLTVWSLANCRQLRKIPPQKIRKSPVRDRKEGKDLSAVIVHGSSHSIQEKHFRIVLRNKMICLQKWNNPLQYSSYRQKELRLLLKRWCLSSSWCFMVFSRSSLVPHRGQIMNWDNELFCLETQCCHTKIKISRVQYHHIMWERSRFHVISRCSHNISEKFLHFYILFSPNNNIVLRYSVIWSS